MENYIIFNAEQFLKDSRNWKAQIKEKQRQLEALTEIRGQSDSVGGGSGISNPTASLALRKIQIQAEIDELRTYQAELNNAMDMLSNEQKDILTGFFFDDRDKSVIADNLAHKYGYCLSDVYNKRKEALIELGEILYAKTGNNLR